MSRIVASSTQRLIDKSIQFISSDQQNEYDFKFVDVSKLDNRFYSNDRYFLQSRDNWQNNRSIETYLKNAQTTNTFVNTNENANWKNHLNEFIDEYHELKKSQKKIVWNNLFVNDFTKNNHEHEYVDVDFVDASRVLKHICRFCQQIFYFNNKLYRHVRIYRKTFSNNNFVVQYVHAKSSKNKKV